MTTYNVHFQAPKSYAGNNGQYQDDRGNKFVVVTVRAGSEKEAWEKAQKKSGLVVVVKIEQKQKAKKTTFAQKLDAIYKNKALLQDRHQFCLEMVALMTSKKANQERVDGYQVKKTGKGFSILFNKKDIGLNNLAASVAYNWCIRCPLNHWVRWAEDVRIEYYDQYGV